MGKFFQEFKDFALRGNVLDMAVGVIIGGALNGVVTSLTDNILSPIIGLFAGANFDSLMLKIPSYIEGLPEITIKYGAFITSVVNFLIMAFVIFLIVRGMNKLATLGKKPEPEAAPTTKTCPFCYTEIPVQATRCPNCTAMLTVPENANME